MVCVGSSVLDFLLCRKSRLISLHLFLQQYPVSKALGLRRKVNRLRNAVPMLRFLRAVESLYYHRVSYEGEEGMRGIQPSPRGVRVGCKTHTHTHDPPLDASPFHLKPSSVSTPTGARNANPTCSHRQQQLAPTAVQERNADLQATASSANKQKTTPKILWKKKRAPIALSVLAPIASFHPCTHRETSVARASDWRKIKGE